MRMPFYTLAAALLFIAAPALAHDRGAINCPIAHAAPAHHLRAVHHAHRSGGCPTQVAHEEHRHMAWTGGGHGWGPPAPRGEEAYGRQNFSWAPTGPGDEHPGPSTWRPGPGGPGLYGAPPNAYAERGPGYGDHQFDHRGVDQRDQGERAFSQQFGGDRAYGHHDFDHRDQGERDFGDRFAHGEGGYGERDFEHHGQGEREFGDRFARGGEGFGHGGADYGGGEQGVDHRGFEQGGHAYAFGYSREEERSWSSHQGGAFIEHRTCHCHPSATDEYGFLTWPGKTHYWHGRPVDGQAGGPAPWADDPQGPIIVHP
jgi:hypothetical protein